MTTGLIAERTDVNPFYYVHDISVDFEELNATTGMWSPVITGMPMNVQTDQKLRAVFHWFQDGFFAGAPVLPVEFFVELIFEKMGTGDDVVFDFGPYAFEVGVGHEYIKELTIELGSGAGELKKGLYKCAALFRMGFSGMGTNDTPVVGFEELGMVNVYQAN